RRSGAAIYEWPSIVRSPNPLRDVRARRELRDAVEAFRPDVLHLHSAKAGVIGRGIVRRPAVTIYTCNHAPFGPGRKIGHRLVARPVEQLTLPHVDGVITIGARDMPALTRLARGVPIALVR